MSQLLDILIFTFAWYGLFQFTKSVVLPEFARWKNNRALREARNLIEEKLRDEEAPKRPYWHTEQYEKIKKLEAECATLRAAKAELDKIRSPEPTANTAAQAKADPLTREFTLAVLDLGMKQFDRVVVKAPGRKDRIVLLRPWSRKMAKAKPVKIKPTRPSRKK